MSGLRMSSLMISPIVAWTMRMSRPLISIRMGVRAWVRPTPMWCSRPLWRRLSLPWNALVSDHLAEGGDHCGPGHRLVAGHREGVAGVVVDKGHDLHIDAGCAVGAGEPVMGEVGLPHFVGLFGSERDICRFWFFLRL